MQKDRPCDYAVIDVQSTSPIWNGDQISWFDAQPCERDWKRRLSISSSLFRQATESQARDWINLNPSQSMKIKDSKIWVYPTANLFESKDSYMLIHAFIKHNIDMTQHPVADLVFFGKFFWTWQRNTSVTLRLSHFLALVSYSSTPGDMASDLYRLSCLDIWFSTFFKR